RLDLSPLAPADGAAWDAVVTHTLARVDAALARRTQQGPLTLIAGWTRAITTMAGILLLILIPVELALEKRESIVEQAERLAQLSARAVRTDRGPTGAELFQALEAPAPQ